MLEWLWKVVEAIIDTRLRTSVRLHDVLHSFCEGRGMGIEIMELKMVQELAILDQEPLFLILLDL